MVKGRPNKRYRKSDILGREIMMSQAPDPSNVIWENQEDEHSKWKIFTFVCCVAMFLFVSFTVSWGLHNFKRAFASCNFTHCKTYKTMFYDFAKDGDRKFPQNASFLLSGPKYGVYDNNRTKYNWTTLYQF